MLVLASNSPRRKQLLRMAGWEFLVMPSEVDESSLQGEGPLEYVSRLAEEKARAACRQWQVHIGGSALWLAADTAVVDGAEILGKPADVLEAEAMLRRLRGRVHQVYTALAVLRPEDNLLLKDVCITRVKMRRYSDEEIMAYIASGDPMDKAGAYAIQHAGFKPVEALDGCAANVVGLPLCHLARLLQSFHVAAPPGFWMACQRESGINCAVYPQILQGLLEPLRPE